VSTLQMTRGDNKTVQVTITGLGSQGLSGASLWFTAKRSYADADAAAIIHKVTADFTIDQQGDSQTPGIAHFSIQPAETSGLPAHQVDLVFDVQMKDSNGNVTTVDSGTLTVTPDVTLAS